MRTVLMLVLALSACTHDDKAKDKAAPATATAGQQHLGAPIAADTPVVALADVVKDPAKFKGKPFVTTGTVTAVCQEMGCWMEIKDDAGVAHVKMAGEKFYVPKTSAGHKARVSGTLVDVAGGDAECAEEAAKQTGGQVAKLQLEATGVELD
ncbi:MAG: DUF4920 domain-containing protein [Deltaproteobacteria bacterium]|nr:DUF4920 domain-containing protein [Deltaproteobacteria bacterium]